MLNKEKTITISLDEYNRLLESQKQVDELTRKVESYQHSFEYNQGYEDGKHQAVKDTAKEIFDDIKDSMRCFEDDDDGYLLKKCEFKFFMREISKRFGVEVE